MFFSIVSQRTELQEVEGVDGAGCSFLLFQHLNCCQRLDRELGFV